MDYKKLHNTNKRHIWWSAVLCSLSPFTLSKSLDIEQLQGWDEYQAMEQLVAISTGMRLPEPLPSEPSPSQELNLLDELLLSQDALAEEKGWLITPVSIRPSVDSDLTESNTMENEELIPNLSMDIPAPTVDTSIETRITRPVDIAEESPEELPTEPEDDSEEEWLILREELEEEPEEEEPEEEEPEEEEPEEEEPEEEDEEDFEEEDDPMSLVMYRYEMEI